MAPVRGEVYIIEPRKRNGRWKLCNIRTHRPHLLKKTIAVTFGQRRAILFSAGSIAVAAVSWVGIYYFKILERTGSAAISISIVSLHAFVLLTAIFKFLRSNDYNRKINKIMWLSLTYIFWFGFMPLLAFLLQAFKNY